MGKSRSLRWSPEDLEAWHKGEPVKPSLQPAPLVPDPKSGMNQTEVRFADKLETERLAGLCLDWRFEPFSLRLGARNFYKPDFLIVRRDHFEIAEIKGGLIREDAIQKFKAARERLPWFRFLMWQYRRGRWTQVY